MYNGWERHKEMAWESDKTLDWLPQCLDWIVCPGENKSPPPAPCLLTCQTTLMHFVSACVCWCVWVYPCVYRCINGHAVDGSGIRAKSGTLCHHGYPALTLSACPSLKDMSLSLLPLFSSVSNPVGGDTQGRGQFFFLFNGLIFKF